MARAHQKWISVVVAAVFVCVMNSCVFDSFKRVEKLITELEQTVSDPTAIMDIKAHFASKDENVQNAAAAKLSRINVVIRKLSQSEKEMTADQFKRYTQAVAAIHQTDFTEEEALLPQIEQKALQMRSGGNFIKSMGLMAMNYKYLLMIMLALFFAYLSIVKKFEPLLLLPLAFGILLANLPMVGLSAYEFQANGNPGLLNIIYSGIRLVVYPPLVFLCIGALTDFAPLIASPKSAIIGIGGQLGIFMALGISYFVGNALAPIIPGFDGFTLKEAATIGIIGSSDGPTSVFTATRLAPDILAPVAIAAFSYMALVPFIQPPIMRMLTTKKERVIVMPEPRHVTKKQKILFPIIMALVVLLLVPPAGPLISMLMLGNLLRESGVVDRIVKALQGDFLSIITMLVGLSIGASAKADYFLRPDTIIILTCGLLAFGFGTVGGVLTAKLLCHLTHGKVNPLIGNSGVSAMPMAARISQRMGQKYNPNSHLLMHAMGPIVSSTIGSAIIAGVFISIFDK